MIEMAVLGVLQEGAAHGYELKKRMAEIAGCSGGVSFGSLYPAINRLRLSGAVRAVDPAQPRPTGATIGATALTLQPGSCAAADQGSASRYEEKRNRKVYRITAKGEARLRELLVDANPSDGRAFHLQVAFCRFLEPAARLGIFERRRSQLITELTRRRRAADAYADPYLRSLRERDIAMLTEDLGWLDDLTRITQQQLATTGSRPVGTGTGGTHR